MDLLPPLKHISDEIQSLEGSSDDLVPTLVPSNFPVRKFYLTSYSSMPGPVISASDFVPRSMVEHLMRNKKDSALAVKFVLSAHSRDAITNMEGALHTFVTPIVPIKMHGDYAYRARHSVEPFADTRTGHQHARDVVLSALVQPDFEGAEVMLELAGLRDLPTVGRPLPQDFHILSVEDKQNRAKLVEYEELLHAHMVYHLVSSHNLPAADSVSLYPMDGTSVFDLLLRITSGSTPVSAVRNVFVEGVPVLSLEILFMTAYHQLRNELSALERLCSHQGYVYTDDPPAIFAQMLGGAELLVRCRAAALRALLESSPSTLSAMRAFAFNDYADPSALSLFQQALAVKAPHVAVVSKASLFRGGANGRRYTPMHEGMRGALLVLHNNSDGFGQNIETEGPWSSLDGAIGCASSAAASLHRRHPHLLDHIV